MATKSRCPTDSLAWVVKAVNHMDRSFLPGAHNRSTKANNLLPGSLGVGPKVCWPTATEWCNEGTPNPNLHKTINIEKDRKGSLNETSLDFKDGNLRAANSRSRKLAFRSWTWYCCQMLSMTKLCQCQCHQFSHLIHHHIVQPTHPLTLPASLCKHVIVLLLPENTLAICSWERWFSTMQSTGLNRSSYSFFGNFSCFCRIPIVCA